MLMLGVEIGRIGRFSLAALAFFVLALGTGAPVYAQTADAVGHVVHQRGVAIALQADTPRVLILGAPVYRGDRLSTHRDAKVEIEFRDGSTLSVGPETDVEITEYAPDGGERGILQLFMGIVRTGLSDVWKDGFEVRTRAAVASVRSTDWITEAGKDRSSVFVVSGKVSVTGVAGGARVTLEPGQGTDIENGGAPSTPKKWGASRVEEVMARTRVP